MRVLLISPLPPPVGGISRWTQIILDSFKKDKKNVVVHINSSPKYRGKVTFFKRLFFGILSTISIVFSTYREFKNGVDVVHITSSGSMALFRDKLVLWLSKRFGVATVLHLHFGRIPAIAKTGNMEWKRFVKVFSFCDAIIAIDRSTEKTLIANGYEQKTYFCPNPIDVESTVGKVCSTSKANKVVFVGHIYREKGIGELIDAWIDISEKLPNYYLELIGSTTEKDFIESLPEDDSIHFIGEKTHDETMNLLSEASLFVLPSCSEGFPNVILEAMALKVPIIATNVGAIPEMLDDGCGVLIEPKSVEQLEEAIMKMFSNSELRSEMVEKSYRRVTEQYDVKNVLGQYMRIWDKVQK